jgi:CRP/FNR family cyclic AMP-dependent transcriptional regulator
MAIDPEFLRRVALFGDLGDSELRALAMLFAERSYGRGQLVFSEDETGHFMYVVREGRVKVSRWLPSGREVILAFHGAGDWFGEMALLDGRTVPAAVTAVIPSSILTLSRARFEELAVRPSFARALLRMLCARCREAWQQIELLNHDNAEARIRLALFRLCEANGERTDRGVRIGLRLTHRELANLAGVSRETATRVLSRLQRENLIGVERRLFVVADPDELVHDATLQ